MHSDAEPVATPPEETLPPGEPQGPTENLIQKTPWWAISTGLHVTAALLIGFFWVIQTEGDAEAVVVTPPRRPRTIPEMEKPKDLNPQKVLDVKETSSEVVFRKDVEVSDHVETADDEEYKKAKGDSLDFVSDKPFKGKGTYDTIGGGGGGGGRYGSRLGGKRDLTVKGGGSGTEDAVLDALRWLARHQSADGSWGVTTYVKQCKQTCAPHPGGEDYDAGVTGLSLLAFLGAGYSHLSRDVHDGICFGDVVRKGLQWMMSHQDPEGCIGSRNGHKYMYNHTVCALAMTEAYGLTGSNLFRENAQKAVDFTVAAQNAGRGWRYSYKSGESDSSVTGWAVMVLKSAELSGLPFPRAAYDGTRAWFDEVTEEAYGRVGYTFKGTGKVYDEHNQHFDHHEALSAIGLMARIFMNQKGDARMGAQADLLLRDKPQWNGNAIDFYYWYYASLALFQYDGPSGPKWRGWNEEMKGALVKNQNPNSTGCRRGSWEPVDRWSCEGGRVYATAINALTLEVYYRYANVFGARDKAPEPNK
jgi:hypothetical protein